jgi:hypothetical protein
MLAIMAISERYGHLQVGGKVITEAQLGVMAGCSEEQAKGLMAELEANGVFSRDENGVPFSRRMVKELSDYQLGSVSGKMGGNPILTQKLEAKKLEAKKLEEPLRGGVKGNDDISETDELLPLKSRIGSWFGRRESTVWSDKELKALKLLGNPPQEIQSIEAYYTARIPKEADYRRRDIQTLLNNWTGEIDRAFRWKTEQDRKRRSVI